MIATVVRNITDTSTGDDFYDAEASAEDSEPRELFVISINDGVTVYYHTSGTRDIFYNGNMYTAIAMERGEISVTMPGGGETDLTLTLPIDHALARRWTAQGVPPRFVDLRVLRQNGGATETIWYGNLTSMAPEGRIARFRVPSRAGEWMLRPIPAISTGRDCSHILYDTGCTVSRTGSHSGLAHKVTTTVTHISGRDIRVDLADVARNGTWAEGGEVVHSITGERMAIALQTDLNPGISSVATLRLQMQIVGLQVGHFVDIYRGCLHDIGTCNDNFGNKENFAGFPQLPSKNPFVPAGYGVAGNI